jgi:hypothetical protein
MGEEPNAHPNWRALLAYGNPSVLASGPPKWLDIPADVQAVWSRLLNKNVQHGFLRHVLQPPLKSHPNKALQQNRDDVLRY